MFNRRIIASVCALAVAVPATASAIPVSDPPGASLITGKAHHVAYGDATYLAQNQRDLGTAAPAAPVGDTKSDLPQGTPVPTVVSAPKAQPADDGTDGWRIATIAEAGLLTALMVGGGLALARRRPAGLGV